MLFYATRGQGHTSFSLFHPARAEVCFNPTGKRRYKGNVQVSPLSMHLAQSQLCTYFCEKAVRFQLAGQVDLLVIKNTLPACRSCKIHVHLS